ncbi:hypothetical protein IB633_06180 [Francisella philomiragia]|uniref:Uncharacterized protein n=1 Tax=Francisella philomiragia subsp. philomiragia (strain ATCC 25017 / CCUG 19701 / FSC 153 / O\|nr:hypothetical protein [Francisella philomiragia]AJI47630.1 hypothetical protein BF30_1796 [Francisella philomiragia]AJI49519.1 hypothetical protein KU46_1777 [Francisella philomiragia]MBK2030655.1 hypothetical protein [Francisella philomiragia]
MTLRFISPSKENQYRVRNSRNRKRILKQEKRVHKLKKQLEKEMFPKKVCIFLTILVFISFISALLMNKNGIKLINFQKQYITYKIRGDKTESIGLLIYQNDNGIYFNSYNRDKKEFWKDPIYIRKSDIRSIYYLPYPYEKNRSIYEYICGKWDVEYFCYFYNKNRKNTTPSV